jgi:hypothetical protein
MTAMHLRQNSLAHLAAHAEFIRRQTEAQIEAAQAQIIAAQAEEMAAITCPHLDLTLIVPL